LRDLIEQALTPDAFAAAAREAFGHGCVVVPFGHGIEMQQYVPPSRIIITDMIDDMVTGAACY
jgi:hypothetical protein